MSSLKERFCISSQTDGKIQVSSRLEVQKCVVWKLIHACALIIAHFERRITFGQDADFTNGVKAKFDGKKLVIEGESHFDIETRQQVLTAALVIVTRRARRPPARITGGPVSLSSDGPLARYPLNRPASSSDAMGAEHALPTKRNHSIAF
jgi:hypothetical protein